MAWARPVMVAAHGGIAAGERTKDNRGRAIARRGGGFS
ncbi:hypothetical protein F8B43_3184 [Methylorubrum populi]|uniref:Uncharacterized protein n=1 Tax=Methylorubrum populi TaxID=223967 RepID=A0A833J7Y4_9HYPH|nr:hypothetical protein F8B43_3184 [Methylorubrum populi]